jgi:MFS family permease
MAYRSALRNPWWIPPFLGGVPEVEPRLVSLLGLVSLALFFEAYDNSLLTSALKFIAADLSMREQDLGGYLAVIRLGSLPAFLLVPFADQIGRRRVFLASVVGFTAGTFLTAFAQDAAQFVILQMLTRTFTMSAAAVAFVIVTEEFPAAYRGWAIGMLGALSSFGHGVGAGFFAAIHYIPYGWRGLYALGLIPLLSIPWLRRNVKETDRFNRHREKSVQPRTNFRSWAEPVLSLARTHPSRALGLAIVGLLFSVGEASVFQFTGYFTQTVHGWSPGEFSLMFIVGGAVGIIGNVAAGRLGDHIGRRRVGFGFLALFPAFAWIFYHGPGWSLPFAWAAFVFCNTAGGVVVRALSTELFPTSHRGTAAAFLSVVQTLGWAGGLAIVGAGTHDVSDIATMTSRISLVVLVAAFFLLLLPETYQQELESISVEAEDEDLAGESAREPA